MVNYFVFNTNSKLPTFCFLLCTWEHLILYICQNTHHEVIKLQLSNTHTHTLHLSTPLMLKHYLKIDYAFCWVLCYNLLYNERYEYYKTLIFV